MANIEAERFLLPPYKKTFIGETFIAVIDTSNSMLINSN